MTLPRLIDVLLYAAGVRRHTAPPVAPPTPAHEPYDSLAAQLDARAAQAGEPIEWRQSVVDLMKALGLDSTLGARRRLAADLGYSGDLDDTAAMNTWLHDHVIAEIEQHGGHLQMPAATP